jgi:hypothetical protein
MLREDRHEFGRDRRPFEFREFVSQYPDRDLVKRSEEAGVTSIVLPAWLMGDMDNPDLQDSLDRVSRLGDDIREWTR